MFSTKKLVLVLMVAFCMLFTVSMLTPADNNDDYDAELLGGTWLVSVHWRNPEIIGDFEMSVIMTNPWRGTVSAEGFSGDLGRFFIFVGWDFGDIAFYKGLWFFARDMFGTMKNIEGNYGTWKATKITEGKGITAEPDVILGAPESN